MTETHLLPFPCIYLKECGLNSFAREQEAMYFPYGWSLKWASDVLLFSLVWQIKQKVPADQLSCVHYLFQTGKEQSSYMAYFRNICVLSLERSEAYFPFLIYPPSHKTPEHSSSILKNPLKEAQFFTVAAISNSSSTMKKIKTASSHLQCCCCKVAKDLQK